MVLLSKQWQAYLLNRRLCHLSLPQQGDFHICVKQQALALLQPLLKRLFLFRQFEIVSSHGSGYLCKLIQLSMLVKLITPLQVQVFFELIDLAVPKSFLLCEVFMLHFQFILEH
jgi:hypothetical protein